MIDEISSMIFWIFYPVVKLDSEILKILIMLLGNIILYI